MRKHPRDFLADVSVNHSRTGGGKAIDNTQGRASRLSSSGVPFARTNSLSPAAATGLRSSPPLQRMTSHLAPRVLCFSSCSVGQCRLTLWGTLDAPGLADVAPPRPFVRSQLCTPVHGQRLLRRPLAVRSRLRPQRRRRRWPDSKK